MNNISLYDIFIDFQKCGNNVMRSVSKMLQSAYNMKFLYLGIYIYIYTITFNVQIQMK